MKQIDWKKFYDKTALLRDELLKERFGLVKVIGESGHLALIKEVQKNLKDGMKVLDVGCGTGHVLLDMRRITDKKVKFIGIDCSRNMIKIARKKSKGIKNISFFLMDAYKTKFKSNYFDIIINRLGPRSYHEIYRILKKKGLFFLYVTDKGDWKEVVKHFKIKEYFGLKEQLKMLKEAGFKIFKVRKFSSTEYYRDINSFAKVLEIVPFKPQINRKKDFKKLKECARKYKTRWGIKSSHKRVLITCTK